MFTKTMLALSAALVLGAAAPAAARGKVDNPLAAFALSGPAAVYGSNPVIGYDSSGAAIFQRRPTPGCPLSLKQQSRC